MTSPTGDLVSDAGMTGVLGPEGQERILKQAGLGPMKLH